MAALFQRAEIKKTEIHGLLDLENKWRRDKDPRNVGLNHAHFGWPVWIRSGRFKKSNQPFLRVRGGLILRLRRARRSRPTIGCRSFSRLSRTSHARFAEAYGLGGSLFLNGANKSIGT